MNLTLSLGSLLLDIQTSLSIDDAIKIIITLFSLLLLALSISAYRKTGFKKIIYAIIAFALFGIQALFDFFGDIFESFDTPYNEVIVLSMTLAILVLFFLALVKRNY